jgi:glucan phosphoethanolaminetransferase (alkaline phosphatase superfamily)
MKTAVFRQLRAIFIALGLYVLSAKIKYFVAVMFVLLAASCYFCRQAVQQRGREILEMVEVVAKHSQNLRTKLFLSSSVLLDVAICSYSVLMHFKISNKKTKLPNIRGL